MSNNEAFGNIPPVDYVSIDAYNIMKSKKNVIVSAYKKEIAGGRPSSSRCATKKGDDKKDDTKNDKILANLPATGLCPMCSPADCKLTPKNFAAHYKSRHPEFVRSKVVVALEIEVQNFVWRILTSLGVSASLSAKIAEVMSYADKNGFDISHGLYSLEDLAIKIACDDINTDGEPRILQEFGRKVFVDGCNLPGPVVGDFCIQKAYELADIYGASIVIVENSNHFGPPKLYVQRMFERGIYGIVYSDQSLYLRTNDFEDLFQIPKSNIKEITEILSLLDFKEFANLNKEKLSVLIRILPYVDEPLIHSVIKSYMINKFKKCEKRNVAYAARFITAGGHVYLSDLFDNMEKLATSCGV